MGWQYNLLCVCVCVCVCVYFSKKEWVGERGRGRERDRERERERIPSRLNVWHGTRRGSLSHYSGIMTWSEIELDNKPTEPPRCPLLCVYIVGYLGYFQFFNWKKVFKISCSHFANGNVTFFFFFLYHFYVMMCIFVKS